MSSYSIIGVVGHIDHGKTSLVAELTSQDTDTLAEEKRRGITIDVGFAHFEFEDHTFAMIDAPGHQKYVGNLLAGVSKVDIGLMVVAGDQGIQEQTLEHTAILRSLGVSKLIVAISRADLCQPDQVESLSEEVELFLGEEGFHDFPVVPVSVITKTGLGTLRNELLNAGRLVGDTLAQPSNLFRMPIDRVISVPGRGCVVAGTIWSGGVSEGEAVQIAGASEGRVRGIESHGKTLSHSIAGRRTAINLAGVSASDVRRGDELVSPGQFAPIQRMVVLVDVSRDSTPIRCPAIGQFHSATTTCEARITGTRRLERGDRLAVIVETKLPVVASFGQFCLFRRPYPVGTFASGRVLAAPPTELTDQRNWGKFAKQLTDATELQRLIAWVDQWGHLDPNLLWLPDQLGVRESACKDLADHAVSQGDCLRLKDGSLISIKLVDGIRKGVLSRLENHGEESVARWIKMASLVDQVSQLGPAAAIKLAIDQLVSSKTIVTTNEMVAMATDETQLSKRQQSQLQQVLAYYSENRAPDATKTISGTMDLPIKSLEALLLFGAHQGLLIDMRHGYWYDTSAFQKLIEELAELFSKQPECTVAQIRDHWGLTRKHVLPLLEYCDREGYTVRSEMVRRAGPQLCGQNSAAATEREP